MRIPGGYAAVNPRFGVPLRDGNPDVRRDESPNADNAAVEKWKRIERVNGTHMRGNCRHSLRRM